MGILYGEICFEIRVTQDTSKVAERIKLIFRNDEKEQILDSPQFQLHTNRESGTSIFGFSGTTTLISFVPKKKNR
ncbi:hypothetical protein LAZ67_13001602 [Cordylochernes scorpioides]|uniref:Uncharacterized protein n=1 Tax=Cordylochernes scorpioides TaxID=51811 RepID=A0ABY6L401_9ARAC|nr:hypothetical protein LAZ67_13001602 [Cordylochernes scorpioides]